jgi:hypothetical protein
MQNPETDSVNAKLEEGEGWLAREAQQRSCQNWQAMQEAGWVILSVVHI